MVLRKYQRSHKQMTVECVSLPLCVFKSKSIHVSKRQLWCAFCDVIIMY